MTMKEITMDQINQVNRIATLQSVDKKHTF